MLLIRQAGPADFSGVFTLAKILDSYNLPADRRLIQQLLEDSERSFGGGLPRSKAQYLFVLVESAPGTVPAPGTGKIVGCSLIIAKHGTRGRPHLWLAREKVTRFSRTLGIRRSQEALRMGFTENGPTEIGGFVVLPAYRNRPQRCGLQLSYARFLYMAMHPKWFEDQVLIEYRGKMGRGNRSPFWEAIGRAFTGLTYSKADRLSVTNKEFIWNLLPRDRIYCALLPESVRNAIGAIHPNAAPAERLARRQGFRRIPQIEPFDGGPYYAAARTKIQTVRRTRRVKIVCHCEPQRGEAISRSLRRPAEGGTPRDDDQFYLVGTEAGGRFRAVRVRGRRAGNQFFMEPEGLERLGVKEGAWGHAYRIPR